MLFCVIAAVLCVCMFPAWPLKLKIGLWYLSVVFLTLLLFLIVLRLVLFLLLWFFGFQFWLLPNLFNEDAGFIDSFLPFTDLQRTPGSWTMVGVRAFCALLSAATVYKLGETHSPADVASFARQSFIDVLDWGRMRLEAPYLDTNKALPSAAAAVEGEEADETQQEEGQRVAGDEEDYRCLGPCGYKSFEDLMVSKCLVKCHCMQELLQQLQQQQQRQLQQQLLQEQQLQRQQQQPLQQQQQQLQQQPQVQLQQQQHLLLQQRAADGPPAFKKTRVSLSSSGARMQRQQGAPPLLAASGGAPGQGGSPPILAL
ncbi:hypothetical protein Efla_000336 [Eimeria flavescens]